MLVAFLCIVVTLCKNAQYKLYIYFTINILQHFFNLAVK